MLFCLQMNTEYEVFVTPFYKSVLGLPSASRTTKTQQGLPSTSPSIQNITLTEDGFILVWSKLSQKFANGFLEGYKIRVNGSGHELTSVTADPSDVSVYVNLLNLNLVDINTVSIEIAAFNKAGVGPYSIPIEQKLSLGLIYGSLYKYGTDLRIGADGGSMWIGALVGSFLIALALIAGAIYFYRRKFSKQQIFQEKTSQIPTLDSAPTKNQSLWIDRRWNGEDSAEGSNSSEKHLLEQAGNQVSENEYIYIDRTKLASFTISNYGVSKPENKTHDLAPYASTDILRTQTNSSVYESRYFVSFILLWDRSSILFTLLQ